MIDIASCETKDEQETQMNTDFFIAEEVVSD